MFGEAEGDELREWTGALCVILKNKMIGSCEKGLNWVSHGQKCQKAIRQSGTGILWKGKSAGKKTN